MKSQWIFKRNSYIFIKRKYAWKYRLEMTAILSRPQSKSTGRHHVYILDNIVSTPFNLVLAADNTCFKKCHLSTE